MIRLYVLIYFLYALVVYLIALANTMVRFTPKFSIQILFVLAFLCSIIGAFRPAGTQDTNLYNLVYQSSYSYINSIKIDSVMALMFNRSFNSIELFYVLLMSYFNKYFKTSVLFFFIQGFLSNLMMMKGLFLLCEYSYDLRKKEYKHYFISTKFIQMYSLYLLMFGILFTSSAIRDGLSISLGITAIGYLLLKRKRLLAIVLFFVSILIHSTSIILILIYVLLRFTNFMVNRKANFVLSSAVPLVYFGKLGKITVGIGASAVLLILKTFNIQAFYSYIRDLDFRLPLREGLILLLSSVILIFSFTKNKINDKYRFIVICGLYIFAFAYPIAALARVLYMFLIFLIPIVLDRNRYSNIIQLISVTYLLPQYVYVFGSVLAGIK